MTFVDIRTDVDAITRFLLQFFKIPKDMRKLNLYKFVMICQEKGMHARFILIRSLVKVAKHAKVTSAANV